MGVDTASAGSRRSYLHLLAVVSLVAGSLVFGTAEAADVLPFNVTDGVPDVATPSDIDGCANPGDDKPINGSLYKLNVIHDAPPPIVEISQVTPGKSDICDVWLVSRVDNHGDVWLYFAWNRQSNTGSQQVYLELLNNSACVTNTAYLTCNPLSTRDQGSQVLVFDFQGSAQDIDVTRRVWNPTGGSGGSGAFGGQLAVGGTTDGRTGASGYFGEAAINLTAAGILPNANQIDNCDAITSAIPYSVTGNADPSATGGTGGGNTDSAEMIDIALFDIDPITPCGQITIEKRDIDGNLLTGAAMALYRVAPQTQLPASLDTTLTGLAGVDGVLTAGEIDGAGLFAAAPGNPCTSQCTYVELPPGADRWFAVELAAPPAYDLSAPNWQVVPLLAGGSATATFTNARVPYWIDVTPDTDLNPVGLAHEFLVVARVDDENTPVPDGTSIGLAWAANGVDPFTGDIVAINHSSVPSTVSTSCLTGTVTWDANSIDGACIVTVNSSATGAGTLTATLPMPYQHATGTRELTSLDAGGVVLGVSSIWAEGDKAWRGFEASLTDDATNLLGDAHAFTVSVIETGPGAGGPAADVVVVAYWSGPSGSTVQGDGTAVPGNLLGDVACTTNQAGSCTFIVASDSTTGTGTLEIASLSGQIGAHDVSIADFANDADITAAKTWVAYRLWVTPTSDTNQIGWAHDFSVHVEKDDGTGWSAVSGATFAPTDWTLVSAAGGFTVDANTCTAGTDAAGVCGITATALEPGAATLTVTGVTVPFDGGTHLAINDGVLSVGDDAAHTNIGRKTWVDYGVTISESGRNLLGQAHPFTVVVTRSDGVTTTELPDSLVSLTWAGPAGSTISDGDGNVLVDLDGGTAGKQVQCVTDAAGVCEFEVDSDTAAGLGTLSVDRIVDASVTDGNRVANIDFPSGDRQVSKEWVSYDVDVDGPAVNLMGDPHVFTITAERLGATGVEIPVGSVVTYGWTGIGTATPPGACVIGSDGTCSVSVQATVPGVGTLTILAISDAAGQVDVTQVADGQSPGLQIPVDTTKTWVGVDASITADATNLVGDPHTFTVTTRLDTGSGPSIVDSDAIAFSATGSAGQIDHADGTCDDAGTTADGTCTIVVSSDQGGQLTVTISSVTVTVAGETFTVDLTQTGSGQLASLALPVAATKTWIDYALQLSPQRAVNLLPTSPSHIISVRLTSTDVGLAPVAGQTLTLQLTSSNGARITQLGGLDIAPVVATTCVTDADGICNVEISAQVAGAAVLSAAYEITAGAATLATISSGDFPGADAADGNGQSADKAWTTYSINVDGPAINLLGSSHEFTITLLQSVDELTSEPVVGAVFGVDADTGSSLTVTAPATISGGTCLQAGTDDDGKCTVIVASGSTTVATLIATYDAAVGQQSAAFTADTTKQWIDYRLSVDPDTAENLVGTVHTFTVTAEVDLGLGDGFQPLPGIVPVVALTGVGELTEDGCAAGAADDGTCQVAITSEEAGQSQLTASIEGTTAITQLNLDAETATFTDEPALKQWVNYQLSLSDDATNTVGDPHVFRATLLTDVGDGLVAAPDQAVGFVLEGEGTVIDIVPGEVAAGDRSGACTTNALGQCDIEILSAAPGLTTVTATYLGQAGETARTFTDDAVKTWVSNPAISLTKTALVPTDGEGLKVIDVSVSDPSSTVVTYEFVITNIGDVPLTDLELEDLRLDDLPAGPLDALAFADAITGLAGDLIAIPVPVLRLGPGESTTVLADLAMRDTDLLGANNIAQVSGTAADGTVVTADDAESIDVVAVLPFTDERERPDPAPDPAPAVLATTGINATQLLILGLIVLALGSHLLSRGGPMSNRRVRRARAR